MRTISAAQEKVLSSSSYVPHLRVQVKDSGGTWRDMTALDGRNWVVGASWGETADQVATASVEFVPAMRKLNLAPLDGGGDGAKVRTEVTWNVPSESAPRTYKTKHGTVASAAQQAARHGSPQ